MRRTPSLLMFLTIASVLAPAVALAQPPVVSEPTSSASFAGATTGHGRGLGVGTVALFDPAAIAVPNLLATWGDSGGRFHVDGLLGFNHTGSSTFDFGFRGWYHVHAASSADLSLGAGFGLLTYRSAGAAGPPPVAASRQWDFELDIGAQIRVFVVPNVALLVGLGLGLYFPDNGPSTVRLSGNIMNSVGLAYYFM
jgi:hypothetical protein